MNEVKFNKNESYCDMATIETQAVAADGHAVVSTKILPLNEGSNEPEQDYEVSEVAVVNKGLAVDILPIVDITETQASLLHLRNNCYECPKMKMCHKLLAIIYQSL